MSVRYDPNLDFHDRIRVVIRTTDEEIREIHNWIEQNGQGRYRVKTLTVTDHETGTVHAMTIAQMNSILRHYIPNGGAMKIPVEFFFTHPDTAFATKMRWA